MRLKLSRFDIAASTTIFLFFWAVYLYTLAPGILFEDTGEFALSLFSLGVSHPPGYPLYTLLGPLFNFLPFASPAFCANIISAFLGALGISVLYFACRSFGFSSTAAAPAAVACGVSLTIWSQSIISEVYSLKLLLDALMLYAIGRMAAGRTRWIAAGGLIAALTAANHYTSLVAFLPVWLLFAVTTAKTKAVRIIGTMATAALALVSLTILYASIPLRAAAGPAFNWQNPATVQTFFKHIERTQYEHWEQQLSFHLPTVLKYVAGFFNHLPMEFNVILLFIAIFGFALLLSSRLRESAALLWLFLVQSVGVMLIVRFHYNELGLSVVRVFYIGAYIAVAIMIAAGIDGIINRLDAFRTKTPGVIVSIAALVAAVAPLHGNFIANNISKDNRTSVFARDILRFLPRDAVLYLKGSHFTIPIMYTMDTGNLRSDILQIDMTGNLLQETIKDIYGKNYNQREIEAVIDEVYRKFENKRIQAFTTPRLFEGLPADFKLRGPFYYLADEPSCNFVGWNSDAYGYKPGGDKNRDYETRQLGAFFQARKAECDFMNGDHKSAFDELDKAVASMPGSANTMLFAGQLADRYGFRNIAAMYYNKALALDPTFTDALLQLGQMMIEVQGRETPENRNFVSAEEYFKKALAVSPGNVQARLALANIAVQNRDFATAEDYYKKLLEEFPENILIYNNLANLYIKTRRINEASKLYETALAYDPDSALTNLNYGSFLIDTGRTDRAFELLRKHIAIMPQSSYGHYNLGLAFHKIGDYNNSVIHYRKAVEIEPKLAQAWTNLISVLLEMDNLREAAATADKSPEPALHWQGIVKQLVSADMSDRALNLLKTSHGPVEAWAAFIILNIQKGRINEAGAAINAMEPLYGDNHADLLKELKDKLAEARSALEPVGGSK